MAFGRIALATGCSAFLALAAACGVSTNASENPATPTPTPQHTATPTPSDTPAPTPTATPAGSGYCSFFWGNDNGDGTIDFYEVDVADGAWKNDTAAFAPSVAVGYFILGYYPPDNTFVQAGMSTSGSIALTVSDTNMGSDAGFADLTANTYLDATDYFAGMSNTISNQQTGSGGTGSFTGKLSNPDPATDVDPGTGTIDITINGFHGTIGGADAFTLDYAVCTP